MTPREFNGALDHWLDDVPEDDDRTDAERDADEEARMDDDVDRGLSRADDQAYYDERDC